MVLALFVASVYHVNMMTFSDQIRRAIEKSGMTRYRISKLADIPESTLSRFMSGKGINTESLDLIAKVLGLNITTNQPKLTPKKGR